jgi:hypothetical protein
VATTASLSPLLNFLEDFPDQSFDIGLRDEPRYQPHVENSTGFNSFPVEESSLNENSFPLPSVEPTLPVSSAQVDSTFFMQILDDMVRHPSTSTLSSWRADPINQEAMDPAQNSQRPDSIDALLGTIDPMLISQTSTAGAYFHPKPNRII